MKRTERSICYNYWESAKVKDFRLATSFLYVPMGVSVSSLGATLKILKRPAFNLLPLGIIYVLLHTLVVVA